MYKKLKEMQEKNFEMFVLAMSYIVDKGWSNIRSLTDEDIAEFEGNGIMTQGYVQDLARMARDICSLTENGVNLYQYCQKEKLFDTKFFK